MHTKTAANFRCFLCIVVLMSSCTSSDFVTVQDTHFEVDGKPYYFIGTNFWYGMNLGSKGIGGDRPRLLRELDALEKLGVTNLRVVAGSEGPDAQPFRIIPSMQISPGVYNTDVVEGLDFLLYEMGKRNMRAVMCLKWASTWYGLAPQIQSHIHRHIRVEAGTATRNSLPGFIPMPTQRSCSMITYNISLAEKIVIQAYLTKMIPPSWPGSWPTNHVE
jgi:hypothetical protein